jgi:hypothetical protein
MQITKEIRACSKNGMLMIVYQEFSADQTPGQPKVEHSAELHVMDRAGKKRLGGCDDLKFDLTSKEQVADFIELFELISVVGEKLRGW